MAINYTQSFGNTTPPAWLTPYLQGGATNAQNVYTNAALAPQSQATLDAQQMAIQRAQAGSPANTAASGYVTNAINGAYLPGQAQANPYLDATFNQAAKATQNQLATQFAGSGRNVGASYAPRADQLNNLATSIYGGAYNNERALQQQAAGMAGQVSANGYMDANALGAVGAAQDARAQQVADYPGTALDEYLRRIGGVAGAAGQETSQSNPYYTDNTANILGTALGIDQLLGGRLSGAAGDYIGGLLGGGSPAGLDVAGGLGAAGGAGFDAWLGTGATDAITGAVAPTLAPIAGEGAGVAAGLAPAATGAAAATGLGSLGGAAFDSWLAGGATDAIAGAAMPTLAPIAGEAAGGAAAASALPATGLNLATLGPIGAAVGLSMALRAWGDKDRSTASGTTSPYASLGMYVDGYGVQMPNFSDPAVLQALGAIDPNSGLRWEHRGGVTTYYNPDGSIAYQV